MTPISAPGPAQLSPLEGSDPANADPAAPAPAFVVAPGRRNRRAHRRRGGAPGGGAGPERGADRRRHALTLASAASKAHLALMAAASIDGAIEDIADEFSFFSDWEERYAHVIDLARALEPLNDSERTEATKVRGCASQVWLVAERRDDAPGKLFFRGDSDAHLVRGLIALLMRVYSGRTPAEILSVEPRALFDRLGLKDALTPQRSNGLFSMIERIRREASAAL